MLTKIISEYRRRKHGFPKKLTRHWLAGDYWKRNDEDEGEPKTCLDYYDEKGKYIRYSTGDKVTLFKEDGYKAVYEITKIRGGPADTLSWDDNKKYNFQLHKVTKK